MKIICFLHYSILYVCKKAICSIKSLINDKKAERLAKRRERRRQRLLEETAEEREARLGKRREAWKKGLLKRTVSTAEAKGKQRLVFTTLCANDTVAIRLYKLRYDIRLSIFDYFFTIFQ